MDCEAVKLLLREYSANGISYEHKKILKGHLRNCRLCKAEYRKVKLRKIAVNFIVPGILVILTIAIVYIRFNYVPRSYTPESTSRNVVSHLIFEMQTEDKSRDIHILSKAASRMGAEVIVDDPFTVRLSKYMVPQYLNTVKEIHPLHNVSQSKINTFLDQVDEDSEVVIKLVFIPPQIEDGIPEDENEK